VKEGNEDSTANLRRTVGEMKGSEHG
jgi:hypothetical protein